MRIAIEQRPGATAIHAAAPSAGVVLDVEVPLPPGHGLLELGCGCGPGPGDSARREMDRWHRLDGERALGSFTGRARTDAGEWVELDGLTGWAEEVHNRW